MHKKLRTTLFTLAFAAMLCASPLAFAQEAEDWGEGQMAQEQPAVPEGEETQPSRDCPSADEPSDSGEQAADGASTRDAGHETSEDVDGQADADSEAEFAFAGDVPAETASGAAGQDEGDMQPGEPSAAPADEAASPEDDGVSPDAAADTVATSSDDARNAADADADRGSASDADAVEDFAAVIEPASDAGAAAVVRAASTGTAKAQTAAATRKKSVSAVGKVVGETVAQGWYTVKSKLGSAFAMYAKGLKTADGTAIELRKGKTSAGFAFKLKKSGDYYRIIVGIAPASAVGRAGKKAVLRTDGGKAALFAFQYDKEARGYRIVDVSTGLALGVAGAAAVDGARIVEQRIAEGSPYQAFTLSKREGLVTTGIYRLCSTMKGTRSLTADGEKARYRNYKKDASQKWYIAPVAGKSNVYVVESIATGKRLEGAKDAKVKVKKAVKGDAKQQWVPSFGGSGIVWKNLATKRPLSTKRSSCKEGSDAMNKSYPSARTRQFTMPSVPAVDSGVYELASASNAGEVLEVVGASGKAGALVRTQERKGANYQKWVYDASAHTLTNANSGLVAAAKTGNAGAAVLQRKASGAATQQWAFEYVGGGKCQVVSLANRQLVLTAAPAGKGGTASTALDANGKEQKWKLVKATVTVEPVGFKLIKDIVNKGHGKLNADYIVIHETANPGATAKNHRDLWSREGYYQDYAVHYTLDWTGNCYYCVPENRLCWQVGNGNSHVIGIELCHATNKSDFKKVWNGGVNWAVWQLKKHGWGIDRLISHNECRVKWGGTDHTDPDDYFESFGKTWKQFKDAVKNALAR